MMRWVKIEDVGDTEFLIEEQVDRFQFQRRSGVERRALRATAPGGVQGPRHPRKMGRLIPAGTGFEITGTCGSRRTSRHRHCRHERRRNWSWNARLSTSWIRKRPLRGTRSSSPI